MLLDDGLASAACGVKMRLGTPLLSILHCRGSKGCEYTDLRTLMRLRYTDISKRHCQIVLLLQSPMCDDAELGATAACLRYTRFGNASSAQPSHDDLLIVGDELECFKEEAQPESGEDSNTLWESCLGLCHSFTEAALYTEKQQPKLLQMLDSLASKIQQQRKMRSKMCYE
jgi:hypothetical protein